MKTEVKSFGRMNMAANHSTRDRCGKLTMTAQNEQDAAILALIGRVFSGIGLNSDTAGVRHRLFLFLLEHADEFPCELMNARNSP